MAQRFLSFTPKHLAKNDVTERQVLYHGIEMAVALQAPDWKVSLPWSQNSWRSPERQTGGEGAIGHQVKGKAIFFVPVNLGSVKLLR